MLDDAVLACGTMTGMTSPASDRLDREKFKYSIVIPVYNSEKIVATTVDRVSEVFTEHGLDHEIILVNDGSTDGSWDVIAEKARTVPRVIALDMLKNYGQHHANLAGMREATGDYVITMDDDLQNPPDQALLLIDEAMTGKDLVFGRFEQQAGRRLPPDRQLDDQHDQPPDLRPADRPRGLELPHPAARRRGPDLRLPDRAPLHHRPGAAVLPPAQPRDRAPRAPPGRQEQLQHGADPPPGDDDPVQLLVVPAALRGAWSASRSPG